MYFSPRIFRKKNTVTVPQPVFELWSRIFDDRGYETSVTDIRDWSLGYSFIYVFYHLGYLEKSTVTRDVSQFTTALITDV